jgi:two-component system, NtrC family, nitrogen regulation response regulator NtrX
MNRSGHNGYRVCAPDLAVIDPLPHNPAGTTHEVQREDRNLLLVDDDPAILEFLSSVLADHGFKIRTAADAAACLECVHQHPINLVITDLVLRGPDDGLAIIRALKLSHPLLPVILMSGAPQGGFADAAKRFGAWAILRKPLDLDTLLSLVEQLLSQAAQLSIQSQSKAGI